MRVVRDLCQVQRINQKAAFSQIQVLLAKLIKMEMTIKDK